MPHKTPMDDIRPLSDAIQVHRNEYSNAGADYSVTTLLDPPRVVFLNKRHLHKVKLYVQDMLHSYNGTGAHAYWQYCLEKIPNTPYQCEERLSITINNRLISGAYDCVYKPELDMYDMKNTSCWKVMFGTKDDWTAQQNMYRWLYLHHHAKQLNSVRIIGLFRDWSLAEKFRNGKKYPTYPAVEYRLPIWEYDKTLAYMEERVNTMIKAENLSDDDLPECTYEDMWAEPDQVAVMSKRLKSRAVRVLSSEKAAENFISKYLANPTCKDTVQTLYLQHRPATRKRCEDWCPVNRYCKQYIAYKKQQVTEAKI
jgi:hypothetical protein